MKYFLDQEFHERFVTTGFWKKKRYHIIELISIGIVCEDGRTYYAISKDFDLKTAWDNEWLRDNVLKSVWGDLYRNLPVFVKQNYPHTCGFNIMGLKNLIERFGKTNKEIASDIVGFTNEIKNDHPRFYGYYADYDWVLFCSLFGKMIELPEGYPMFCIDTKQELDEIANENWSPTEDSDYPINTNEHNALADAAWIMNLHLFLQQFKKQ